MGVNAQTTVPKFTDGQVLTAAQQTAINTGIPVFATTTTRDDAFGGTGEKVLAEGQMAYIENIAGSAAVQYYDGAAWQTLVTGGLTFITGATFTTVTSFSLPNGTFSSTYDNYKVIIDVTNISATQTLSMRLRAGGTDNTTSNYYQSSIGIATDGTSRNLLVNGGTSFNFGGVLNTFPEYASFSFDVISPNLARTTELHGTLNWSAATYFAGAPLVGGHTSTTQFDAFSVIVAGGATFSGTYRIYGYQNS